MYQINCHKALISRHLGCAERRRPRAWLQIQVELRLHRSMIVVRLGTRPHGAPNLVGASPGNYGGMRPPCLGPADGSCGEFCRKLGSGWLVRHGFKCAMVGDYQAPWPAAEAAHELTTMQRARAAERGIGMSALRRIYLFPGARILRRATLTNWCFGTCSGRGTGVQHMGVGPTRVARSFRRFFSESRKKAAPTAYLPLERLVRRQRAGGPNLRVGACQNTS
jgi:hypothetical protein